MTKRLLRGARCRLGRNCRRSERAIRVPAWCDAVLTYEAAGKEALIAKTRRAGHVRQRVTGANQLARQRDPPLDDVCMGRQSELSGEAAKQLEPAQAGLLGQVGERDRWRRVLIDRAAAAA